MYISRTLLRVRVMRVAVMGVSWATYLNMEISQYRHLSSYQLSHQVTAIGWGSYVNNTYNDNIKGQNKDRKRIKADIIYSSISLVLVTRNMS